MLYLYGVWWFSNILIFRFHVKLPFFGLVWCSYLRREVNLRLSIFIALDRLRAFLSCFPTRTRKKVQKKHREIQTGFPTVCLCFDPTIETRQTHTHVRISRNRCCTIFSNLFRFPSLIKFIKDDVAFNGRDYFTSNHRFDMNQKDPSGHSMGVQL